MHEEAPGFALRCCFVLAISFFFVVVQDSALAQSLFEGQSLHSTPSASAQGAAARRGARISELADTVSAISDNVSSHLKVLEIVLVAVVMFMTVALGLAQLLWQRANDARLVALQVQTQDALTRHSEKLREMETDLLAKSVAEIDRSVATRVPELVEDVLKSDYQPRIAAFATSVARDVIGITPQRVNATVGILSRFGKAFRSELAALNADAAVVFSREFGDCLDQWHGLVQLYSSDSEVVRSGLLKVQACPFPEASSRLGVLRAKYREDLELRPVIEETIQRVEERLRPAVEVRERD